MKYEESRLAAPKRAEIPITYDLVPNLVICECVQGAQKGKLGPPHLQLVADCCTYEQEAI